MIRIASVMLATTIAASAAILAATGSSPAAARAAGDDPVITVSAGGDRTGGTTVAGLAGVRFDFYAGTRGTPPASGATPDYTCTTSSSGTCSVDATAQSGGSGDGQHGYWVVQSAVPSGWFASSELDTGTSGSVTATDYSKIFVGNVTTDISVPVARPQDTNDPLARGGHWASSRDDPPAPMVCGLKVAMLIDVSGSMAPNMSQVKDAANGFVDALTGTPSSVAVYTFSTKAPANDSNNSNLALTSVSTGNSAGTVKAKIDELTANGGTNWDQGLWQIAADPTHYDGVLMLTDGNPTFYGPDADGPGNRTRLIELENGIFSANAIKAKGTTIVGVGLGDVADSHENLAAISGPKEGTDYFTTSFDELEKLLKAEALKTCGGTVNVVKQVVPASSPGDLNAATPAPGWTFDAAPGTVEPQTGVTDDNGAVSFKSPTSQAVTLTETTKPGYQLIQPGGDNAVCRNSSGDEVPVTNAATGPGFTVDANMNQIISCVVYNQQLPPSASVVLNKTWDINGVRYAEGDQGTGFHADPVLDPIHPEGATPAWGQRYHGYTEGGKATVGEENVTVPAGCVNHPSGDTGTHTLASGLNTFRILNKVRCISRLTLVKRVLGGPARPARWTLVAAPARTSPPAPRIQGHSGEPSVTDAAISPDVAYRLTETGPRGYRLIRLSCAASGTGRPVQLRGNVLTAGIGEHVTCTFTNKHRPRPRVIPVTG